MKVMLSASTAVSYTTVYVTQVVETLIGRGETQREAIGKVKKAIMRNNESNTVRFEMVASTITEDKNTVRVLISYYIIRIQ